MNLYLFNANDSAATFGIGTYIKELTNALKGIGIHIHIVHLHYACTKFEIVKKSDVENWYIPEVRNDNTFSGSVQKAEDYYRNVIYILRLNIKDTKNLIFHFNYNQCFALAKGLKEVFECKTVTTAHYFNWTFDFLGNISQLHELKAKLEKQRSSYEKLLLSTYEYENLLYKETDRIITLSLDMKNLFYSEYQLNPEKISVIPNGLEDVNISMKTNRNILRQKWHISGNEFIVLFAGRFHKMKGLIFLIKAFNKVLEKEQNCRLIIAGNGNYDVFFRECKGICTKVTFTGLLKKDELYELYQIADVGVMPSLYEPFGYVAVEMMMHVLPVVVTATSGLNEVVDDKCGLKIPLTKQSDKVEINTDLLAEKILYLLKHPAEAKKMGQNGRKRYLKEYSSKVFRKNMLNFYNSLFDSK